MKTCKIIVPKTPDACGKTAERKLTFKGDDEPTPACLECTLLMQQIAASHGTTVKVEPL